MGERDEGLGFAWQTVPMLTPRQSVCLAWSAIGRSLKEISDLEKLDVKTVAGHLENARYALRAKSIANAASIAIMMRLI